MKRQTKHQEFATALRTVCEYIISYYSPKGVQENVKEDTKEETNEVAQWPKSFSVYTKEILSDSDRAGIVGQVLQNCSCVCWMPEKIELIHMSENGVDKEAINYVADCLQADLDFNGEFIIRPRSSNSTQTAGRGRPKKEKENKSVSDEPKPSIDDIKKACVELANKLNSKEIVLELLQKFGGKKVSEIDESQYPALLNAIKNYKETTTSSGQDDEF